MTALLSKSNETMGQEDEKSSDPDWSELPDLVTEKIYSFLNRKDQTNMSLVCRSWRKEYTSPSLWRRFKFNFPSDLENDTLCPGVIFAQRYGAMFHHVEICSKYHLDFPNTGLKQLKLFMEALTVKSQLLSISFSKFWYLILVNDEFKADFYPALMELMTSQKKLQCFEFKDSKFRNPQIAEILNFVFENSSKTLRYLHFYGIEYIYDLTNFKMDDDLHFLAFMNLEVLTMDYSQVFEKMVMSFYEYRNRVDTRSRKGRLKKIILLLKYRDNNDLLGLHPGIWVYFRNIFPDLTIDLTCVYTAFRVCSKCIVSQMPLRKLTCGLCYFEDYGLEIGSLLRHITSCGIDMYLEELEIHWKVSTNLLPELITFTDVCTKLKTLKLAVEHPVTALDAVFNSWMAMSPALQDVEIIITKANTEEDKNIYRSLHDTFAPLLQQVGIELSVSADSKPRALYAIESKSIRFGPRNL